MEYLAKASKRFFNQKMELIDSNKVNKHNDPLPVLNTPIMCNCKYGHK